MSEGYPDGESTATVTKSVVIRKSIAVITVAGCGPDIMVVHRSQNPEGSLTLGLKVNATGRWAWY